ncbi:metalloprotease PmbA [Chitinilyticum litopenaei]|uniref:metalloprotease PmbA n=1 Tax=Chitinilyticum litopenaei TaxID=1121276 RepID=UPI0004271E3B|nr:metalloprotease PmbA [Chitinilyticum litopenaei]
MSEFSHSQQQLHDLSQQILAEARSQGATACDVEISEACGLNVSVRLGEVETLEYNRDKGVGVTVYLGQQKGHASSSDFTLPALRDTVSAALAIARHTAADPFAGLADPALFATEFGDYELYHPQAIVVDEAIREAQACEAAARAVDARISNSEGASFASSAASWVYANSLGFAGGGMSTRYSLSAAVIAEDVSGMQRDYWYDVARARGDLGAAEWVGRRAGERTVRRLGARRIKTGNYPVLFEAALAGSLIGQWVSAVSGSSLYRQSSFLLDSLGTQVFAPCVSIIEDPFLPRGMASGAFDSEGVATRRRTVVEAGMQQGYFLGSYSARKLGMQTTGNAGGAHNLIVPSTHRADALLRELGTGLYVTELLGHGVNLVTGDYSRGAAGFWVENGQIVHPVEEITIAGNLRDMYRQIVAIGDDVLPGSSRRVGSILIEQMTVAGS